ncbi:MAG: cytochrome c family protein [Chloroflexi bacterium OLB14]|nr:MAG: cytochrome c family protein [Chloroflexi bacterium OLB14]
MRLFKQLVGVFIVLAILLGGTMILSYDVFKLEWVGFMELQPSFDDQESPLQVPAQSVPVNGIAYLSGSEPTNPVEADQASIDRGSTLYQINCAVCHGATGLETTTIAAYLTKVKPANLTSDEVQAMSDGQIFLTISNGVFNPNNSLFPDVQFSGQCPPLNENLTVRERWDVVNFVRTLAATK